jgi:hypothetical protein
MTIVAVQDQPLPFNLVGVFPTIITNDR